MYIYIYCRHLQALQAECLPLELCNSDSFSPGWDSSPFCINLSSAYNGNLGPGCREVPELSISGLVKGFEAMPTAKFQGAIYDNIYKHQFCAADHWHILIDRRLSSFGVQNPAADVFCSNLKAALHSLPATHRKGHSLMFVKTIVNSWSTSHRYHETVRLPCIFGCEGCQDCLEHYLSCDILWTAACSALGLNSEWLNLNFPQRIGYPCPNNIHIYLNAVMFKTYHCLRCDFSNMISLSVADNDFSDIHSRSFFLATHFASEMNK